MDIISHWVMSYVCLIAAYALLSGWLLFHKKHQQQSTSICRFLWMALGFILLICWTIPLFGL